MLARLKAAHWNPPKQRDLEMWIKQNIPSPHLPAWRHPPTHSKPGTDPGLIPDDRLALVHCDPRLVPQIGGQGMMDVHHTIWWAVT